MANVSIEYDVSVPMRDGVILRADVYRPVGEGAYPVIVARTPYDKTDMFELLYLDPWLASRQGFIAVVQDVRGRFASEGEFAPFTAEGPDGEDTINWAASLPGSNGSVGMWGPSYLGNVQWQAASRRPAALKAIVPQFTFNAPEDGLASRGGARELGLVRHWGIAMGFDRLARLHGDDACELEERLNSLVEAIDGMPGRTYRELPTGTDPVLARHDLPNLAAPESVAAAAVGQYQEKVVVPSLHIGGWYDLFVQGTINNYLAAAKSTPAKLVIGPWNHVAMTAQQGDINFGLAGHGSAIEYSDSIAGLSFDWLKSWLTGEEAADCDLPVKIYVMGANEWRSEPEWPLSRAVETAWFLSADAGLHQESDESPLPLTFQYDPDNPVPTVGGAYVLPHVPAGSFDQSRVEDRHDVLVFTSDVLNDDVEVTGRVSATLTVSTDAPTTDWVVRLCDVHPDGRSFNVVDGISRVEADAGETSVVEVDLWSTSIVFRKGHRIRVQVTSSCFPRWDRNLNTKDGLHTGVMRVASQRVHVGGGSPSFVTLPVVPVSRA